MGLGFFMGITMAIFETIGQTAISTSISIVLNILDAITTHLILPVLYLSFQYLLMLHITQQKQLRFTNLEKEQTKPNTEER
jgi:hypothetical protein